MKIIFSIWFILSLTCYANATADLEKLHSIKIIDGDTLHGKNSNGDIVKVRFCGIDAPEIKQDKGFYAKNVLESSVNSNDVFVDILYYDRYQRAVANVMVNDKIVNLTLVAKGAAWVSGKYVRDCLDQDNVKLIYKLQTNARQLHIGLWSDENPMPPWIFRKK